jgi:hypothetical protein
MGKHRTPFLNNDVISLSERNKTPEQKLWIAVLAKAFEDAFKTTDTRAALEALSWIKNGSDFNYVCHLAGRDGNYVKAKMLNKVIEREASILMYNKAIKVGVAKIVKLKSKKPMPIVKKDYSFLPKYTHDYVER